MGLEHSRALDSIPNTNTFRLLQVRLLEGQGAYARASDSLAGVWPVYQSDKTVQSWKARLAVNLKLRVTRAHYGDGPELGAGLAEALRFVQQRFAADPLASIPTWSCRGSTRSAGSFTR